MTIETTEADRRDAYEEAESLLVEGLRRSGDSYETADVEALAAEIVRTIEDEFLLSVKNPYAASIAADLVMQRVGAISNLRGFVAKLRGSNG